MNWLTRLLTCLPLIAIFALFLTAPAHADTLTVNSLSIDYDQQNNDVVSFDISGVDNYFFNDTFNTITIALPGSPDSGFNIQLYYINFNSGDCNQPQSGEVVCTNLPIGGEDIFSGTLQPGNLVVQIADQPTTTFEYGYYYYAGPPTPTPTAPVTPGLTLTPGVPITPTTTDTLSPSPYPDGSYPDPVTVTLSASATYGNTVADTYYTIDGGSQQTYSSPFTVTGSGSHTITYWSVDSSGNQESPNTQTFFISEAYSLSGTVFTDTNHDGVQDNSEQGYPNATVTVSQNNQTVASTTTDNNGAYSFPSIESGIYSVVVTVPSGDIATTSNPATVDLTANTTQNFGIAPATTTLTPSHDSFIQHNGQNQNEGASPFLELSVEGKERALIQFDESQIQAAIGDDSNYTATLQLTIVSNNNKFVSGGGKIDVDRMEQAWTEGNGSVNYNNNRGTGSGVTWDCATDSNIANDSTNCSGSTVWDMIDPGSWPFDGTPTATGTISNNQSGIVSYNVTSDVQSFLNGTANYGWIVKKDNEDQDGDVQFGSKESSFSPKLIITDN